VEPVATETRPGRLRRFAVHPATGWSARFAVAGIVVASLIAIDAAPALAQSTTETVSSMLNRIRNWIMGLAGLFAVIMATIAGIRYMASSDPAQTEKAKAALRAAAVGLGLVLFAPVLIEILEYMVGSHSYADE
jgi:type IV secretory pathway VirB2 component (pilin)